MSKKKTRTPFVAKLRNYFITGVVVLIPIGITLYLTLFLIKISSRLIPKEINPNNYLPFSIPGLEILLSVALVLIAIIVYYLGYMLPFMGIVFLLLSILKLIDLKGFANMFVQYDLIAAKSKAYAHVYPFIELSLGLMYLFTFQIMSAAIITLLIMGIGAIGVGKNLLSKNKIKCACLGAKVKVPLTSFTLVEDIIMALMALMILIGF